MHLNRLIHIRSLLIAEQHVAELANRFWLRFLLTSTIFWLSKAIEEVRS